MSKIIFICLILFSSTHTLCQSNNDYDSLRKYSYSIFGFEVKGVFSYPRGGSCFFIRNNNKIFLITAKHVVSGCDGGIKDKYYPSILVLSIHNSNGVANNYYIPINISKIIDTTSCIVPTTDIIAFEINDSNTNKLFSVENFIHAPFKKTGDVNMFGFPGDTYFKNKVFEIPEASHLMIKRQSIEYDYFHYKNSNKLDSSCLIMVSNELMADTIYLKGYSGSPVFIKKYHSEKIRVCGAFTIFGFDKKNTDFRYIGAAKIEYALDQINNLFH